MERSRPIRTECFLLCDYARESNGKIDILGGGWDHIQPDQFPALLHFQVAIKLVVPIELANQPIDLTLKVLQENGVDAGEELEELTLLPGSNVNGVPDSEIAMFLPLRAQIEASAPASYWIQLVVNGERIAETRLTVSQPLATLEEYRTR